MPPLLEVERVSKRFRGVEALDAVSFSVGEGDLVALIGPNGAGKTTCFDVISGSVAPDAGAVRLDGRTLTGLRPDRICHAGVGRTFQLVRPFAELSVLDNAIIGALRVEARIDAARSRARRALERLELGDRLNQRAASLTLPDRRRLEVARALATAPRLLLLDEVMAGLRPTETDRMVHTLEELNREQGLTIVLIEHVMRAVMALSRHVIVLNHGRLIAEGPPDHIARHPAVLQCYLGEGAL